jgi:Ca-activated chloride channel homolog
MSKPVSAILTLILSLLILSGSPGQAAQQREADQSVKLGVELVVMDVQVLKKPNARAVGDLKKEDFVVYEDGIKQAVTHFSQDRLPLSVVLLLDVSRSVRPFTRQIRDGALQALQRLKPEDEVALAAFATSTRVIQSFTKDRRLITDRIEDLYETAEVGRATFLPEAVYQAAGQLKRASTPESRRVIIAITDNISTQQRFMGHSGGEAVRELYETGGVVCGLLIGGGLGKQASGVRKVIRYAPPFLLVGDPADIDTFADRTGGEVMRASSDEIETRLVELIEHLRTRYAIGYTPSNSKHDGKFRKVKVTVSAAVEAREGKLSVLTRRGYYAAKG